MESYKYNTSPQFIFLYMSDLFFINLLNLKKYLYTLKEIDITFLLIIKALIFIVLLLIIIYLYFFNFKRQKYILITHRDINTKQICNFVLINFTSNIKNILNSSLNYLDNKNKLTSINNIFIYKNNNISGVFRTKNSDTQSLYNELQTNLSLIKNKNIDIYLYDTHDRYIDTLCYLFGEKELIRKNNIFTNKNTFFTSKINNTNIHFYLIDEILKLKNQILVLEMIQTIKIEDQALQKIYYYDIKDYNLSIVKLLLKIVIFICDHL